MAGLLRRDGAPVPEAVEKIDANFTEHAQFCRDCLVVEAENRQLIPMILSPGQLRLHEAIA